PVAALTEHGTPGAAEQAPVRCRAEAVQVGAEQADQLGRDWHRPGGLLGPVLEVAFIVGRAGVGPLSADSWGITCEQQQPPARLGELHAVGLAEEDRFTGTQAGVVQAAKERGP